MMYDLIFPSFPGFGTSFGAEGPRVVRLQGRHLLVFVLLSPFLWLKAGGAALATVRPEDAFLSLVPHRTPNKYMQIEQMTKMNSEMCKQTYDPAGGVGISEMKSS